MKRQIVFVLALCLCLATHAKHNQESKVNYGVKAGFSSTIYDIIRLEVNSAPINEYSAKSELSSFFTVFTRFNIKRHYLQTELSYNISNYSILFPSYQWDPTLDQSQQSVINTQINGLELPIYYGYHILKEGPYGMSFYIGPKAKYVINEHSRYRFSNFPYSHIEEQILPLNFSLMVGLGVSINRMFFDFSFEYGLHNISQGIKSIDNDGTSHTQGIIFDRRKNVLSFSFGLIL